MDGVVHRLPPLAGCGCRMTDRDGSLSLAHPCLTSDHACRRGKSQPGRAGRILPGMERTRHPWSRCAKSVALREGCEANLQNGLKPATTYLMAIVVCSWREGDANQSFKTHSATHLKCLETNCFIPRLREESVGRHTFEGTAARSTARLGVLENARADEVYPSQTGHGRSNPLPLCRNYPCSR
jgi:hypothetical protein